VSSTTTKKKACWRLRNEATASLFIGSGLLRTFSKPSCCSQGASPLAWLCAVGEESSLHLLLRYWSLFQGHGIWPCYVASVSRAILSQMGNTEAGSMLGLEQGSWAHVGTIGTIKQHPRVIKYTVVQIRSDPSPAEFDVVGSWAVGSGMGKPVTGSMGLVGSGCCSRSSWSLRSCCSRS
jgi:hypothetical protein